MSELTERLHKLCVDAARRRPLSEAELLAVLDAKSALDAKDAEIARLTAERDATIANFDKINALCKAGAQSVRELLVERDAAWNALAWLMAAYRLESPCPIEAITGSAEHLPTIERAISLKDTPCAPI